MPENRQFLPEGWHQTPPPSPKQLQQALDSGEILQGIAKCCDSSLSLTVPMGSIRGRIPKEEVIAPWVSGANREISYLTRVGKEVCFTVKSITSDPKGSPCAILSRREAQEQAMAHFRNTLKIGQVLPCRVTHTAPFGAFLDVGCGIIALLPLEWIGVSRLTHSDQRFVPGQKILGVVRTFDPVQCRITLSHRELLGTWMENACLFAVGQTVEGIVRSVKDYGCFIELTPNLSGLAENRMNLSVGDRVSVYIKAIRPETMKIKLQVVELLPPSNIPDPLHYQITGGVLERWVYSPPGCEKGPIETVFTENGP